MQIIWRTRIIICSDSEIEFGEYCLNGARIRIQEIDKEKFQNPKEYTKHHRLVDIYLPKNTEQEIYQYYLDIHELIDELIDVICLVGYSNAYMSNFFSSCPASVNIGETFNVAIRQISIEKELNQISLNDLKPISKIDDSFLKPALRFFRKGLNSSSSEEKLLMYFTVIERIAEGEVDKNVIRICENCNFEKDTGMKATSNFISNILRENGIDKKEADRIRKLRHKIAHGGGKRNIKFAEEVNEKAGRLEIVVTKELAKRYCINPVNKNNVVVGGIPMFLHTCVVAADGSFDLINSEWRAPLQFPTLTDIGENNKATAGCPLNSNGNPIIDPLAWPEVKK